LSKPLLSNSEPICNREESISGLDKVLVVELPTQMHWRNHKKSRKDQGNQRKPDKNTNQKPLSFHTAGLLDKNSGYNAHIVSIFDHETGFENLYRKLM
jgi:hypothetical protein